MGVCTSVPPTNFQTILKNYGCHFFLFGQAKILETPPTSPLLVFILAYTFCQELMSCEKIVVVIQGLVDGP
jgi:hypothetical protein